MALERANQKRSVLAVVPIIVAMVYGASPIDLIPDVLPLIGWVDDGVMGVLMSTISVWLWIRSRRQRLDRNIVRVPSPLGEG